MSLESARRAEATTLLEDPQSPATMDRLLPLLYDELHEVAHKQLRRERPEHTLNTTALVHEAYLRLVDSTRVPDRGRAYFFGAASRAMRQVLVDYARRRKADKRGGGRDDSPLDEVHVAVDAYAVELIDLDAALEALAGLNPRHSRVVECRFFGGLSVQETAEALGVSTRTVEADWTLARAWLYDRLESRD